LDLKPNLIVDLILYRSFHPTMGPKIHLLLDLTPDPSPDLILIPDLILDLTLDI